MTWASLPPQPPAAGGPAAAAAGPGWETWLAGWLSPNVFRYASTFTASDTGPVGGGCLPFQTSKCFAKSPLPRTLQRTYICNYEWSKWPRGMYQFFGGEYPGSGNGTIPVRCTSASHLEPVLWQGGWLRTMNRMPFVFPSRTHRDPSWGLSRSVFLRKWWGRAPDICETYRVGLLGLKPPEC